MTVSVDRLEDHKEENGCLLSHIMSAKASLASDRAESFETVSLTNIPA